VVHSILITNLNGAILYSKYYDDPNEEEIFQWEQTLYKLTNSTWTKTKNENKQIAISGYLLVGFLLLMCVCLCLFVCFVGFVLFGMFV